MFLQLVFVRFPFLSPSQPRTHEQKWWYGKEGMSEGAVSGQRAALAAWLREGLVKLGPTFIKIGQQFSTRVDVLSPEFIKELEKLQVSGPRLLLPSFLVFASLFSFRWRGGGGA